jgi:hypothetical protein
LLILRQPLSPVRLTASAAVIPVFNKKTVLIFCRQIRAEQQLADLILHFPLPRCAACQTGECGLLQYRRFLLYAQRPMQLNGIAGDPRKSGTKTGLRMFAIARKAMPVNVATALVPTCCDGLFFDIIDGVILRRIHPDQTQRLICGKKSRLARGLPIAVWLIRLRRFSC